MMYLDSLKELNHIKFTHREIDILACLLSGKSAKNISQFLSVAAKTIETHMRNIMLKLDCKSRDDVIECIENSDKLHLMKRHYLSLLEEKVFEKKLKKIAELISDQAPTCLIVNLVDHEKSNSILSNLETHLKLAGLKVLINTKEIHTNFPDPKKELQNSEANFVIYALSENTFRHLEHKSIYKKTNIGEIIKSISQTSHAQLLIHTKQDSTKIAPKKLLNHPSVNFMSIENYYLIFFDIVRKLIQIPQVQTICNSFKEQNQTIYNSSESKKQDIFSEIKNQKIQTLLNKMKSFLALFYNGNESQKKVIYRSLILLLVGAFSFLCFSLIENTKITTGNLRKNQEKFTIRQDLVLPTEALLIQRPIVTHEISKPLEGTQGIQAIALVGIGGAGKTTLARHYARLQDASVVWEFNAETKEDLNDSFEALADALARTEEEKKHVRELQDIQDVEEREKKVILFVRDELKNLSNWILIYDNVDKFTGIQAYFPHDARSWGEGKVILTTRDKNIESNSYIDKTIYIGELSPKEKLDLFLKIMNNGNLNQLTSYEKTKAKKFLEEIPPFPLDVSIAAYYIKTTNIPYKKYINHLKENTKDFELVQENVLKEATEYTNTRYNIITLSLQSLISSHRDFLDLLMFVSILNFKNIPKDLLSAYKGDIVLDNFIYHLKKYSLVTTESPSTDFLPSFFSMHRSTQEISLDYLLKNLNMEQKDKLLQNILKLVIKHVTKVTDVEDIPRIKNLIAHCEVLLQNNHILDVETKITLKSKLGYIYYYLNDYPKAKSILEACLADIQANNYKNYEKLAHVLRCLGDVYSELGEHEKAISFCEQSLKIYREYLPENHTGYPRALAYLGNVYRRLGNYQKAKDLYEKTLAIYNQHKPEDRTREARVLAHLAITHKELGNYETAKELLKESLGIYTAEYSDNHTRVAWVLAHLGSVYKYLGKFEKAKALLELSLTIYRQNFSENHIRIGWATSLLGGAYSGLQDYQTAKKLIESSLVTYEKTLGKNSTEMARVLRKLGNVYILVGQFDKGEALVNNALEILEKHNHPDRYACLEILGKLYLTKSDQVKVQGDNQQAESYKEKGLNYLKEADAIIHTHFPPNSPHQQRIAALIKNVQP